jgi:hypothetical protein
MPITALKQFAFRILTGLVEMTVPSGKTILLDKMSATPEKLTGRAFYESIGSPKIVLAPMVDRSEFVGSCSMISL